MENFENDLITHSGLEVQEIISLNRFAVLSILSLGLYPLYWNYKAWQFFKEKDDLEINSAARTLFSYFFISSLFKKILIFAREAGYSKTFSPTLLHAAFVVVVLFGYLPEPYFLVTIFSFIIFIPPFEALNFAKANTVGVIAVERKSFNTGQIVLIVIGSILWSLGLLGILMNTLS